jgi:DNA-binding XRE family transcriptional regulator
MLTEDKQLLPTQIIAARALLSWNQSTLAKHASLSHRTIEQAEQGRRPSQKTLTAIRQAFEAHGLAFIGRGVIQASYLEEPSKEVEVTQWWDPKIMENQQ